MALMCEFMIEHDMITAQRDEPPVIVDREAGSHVFTKTPGDRCPVG